MVDQPDLEDYRHQARTWLAANLEPRDPSQSGLVRGDGSGSHTAEDYLPERALQKKLHEAGYAGINWPREYGGQGLSDEHARAFAEEAAGYRTPELGHAGGTTYGPSGQQDPDPARLTGVPGPSPAPDPLRGRTVRAAVLRAERGLGHGRHHDESGP
ncbi:acyl-CoA dehydrogenase family protein [Parafrankia soli]|uniref:acyl-CoA dehydrogenase family protein n=1 Tax=Parafrankia soli TaxID=2599596 RepID=UPI001F525CE4|nr:acyl-CoA dehydrogenase family protein [Parafrankia soli]